MRRSSLGELDSLCPDAVAYGGIPDRFDNCPVGIRCRRSCRRRHIRIVGRRAISALLRSTCRSVRAHKSMTGNGREQPFVTPPNPLLEWPLSVKADIQTERLRSVHNRTLFQGWLEGTRSVANANTPAPAVLIRVFPQRSTILPREDIRPRRKHNRLGVRRYRRDEGTPSRRSTSARHDDNSGNVDCCSQGTCNSCCPWHDRQRSTAFITCQRRLLYRIR